MSLHVYTFDHTPTAQWVVVTVHHYRGVSVMMCYVFILLSSDCVWEYGREEQLRGGEWILHDILPHHLPTAPWCESHDTHMLMCSESHDMHTHTRHYAGHYTAVHWAVALLITISILIWSLATKTKFSGNAVTVHLYFSVKRGLNYTGWDLSKVYATYMYMYVMPPI